jgi:hypothetical protein
LNLAHHREGPIVLADFDNQTGETAFDDTQAGAGRGTGAIAVSKRFPEERVRETLHYMNCSPDERVTNAVAREICQRDGIKAMFTGTSASLGSHYVITRRRR